MKPAPPVTRTVEGIMCFYRVQTRRGHGGVTFPFPGWRESPVRCQSGPFPVTSRGRHLSNLGPLSRRSHVGSLERRMVVRSAARAAATANAVRPFARTGAASIPSFASGWMVSELPLHTAALEARGTANAIRKGALRTWTGRSLVALDAVGWARLYRL